MMPGFRKKLFACCRASRDKDERILDYRHRGLKEIPGDVFRNQRTLEELHLDKNQMKTLASEMFSSCTNLRKLTLCDNELTQLPSSLGNLLLLEELDVSRNLLVDVPPSIVSCRNLKVLDLSFNPLHISTLAITQLFSLVKLCLNSASIEYLPAALGRLSNLRVLELRENSIQVLPQAIASLSQLERLDLGKNRLTEMPDVIGCLTNLHELCCDNNRISRISSRALSPLSRLIFLDLSCNHIVHLPSEPLPVSLGDLHLSSNRLRSLPESLCALENLTTLKVDNNALECLPNQLGYISTLAELNASKNRIEWLPPSIGMLRHLHTLQIDDNRLVELPGELGTCSNLSLLSLANNKLCRLPDEVGNLRRLKVLVLSGNALVTLPYSFIGLHQLQALWLAEGQSKPVVQLHEDTDPSSGQRVLTCVLLPQRAAIASGHSPCKDASNSQDINSRPSRHHRQHNSQRLAGVAEEEENIGGDGKTVAFAESEENTATVARSRHVHNDPMPQPAYIPEEVHHRRRSSRRNPMVVDSGADDISGYRSDVDGYRFHHRHGLSRTAAHFGQSAGLCRPFEHPFQGDPNSQPAGRPPLPLPYYGLASMADFQFPPAHRSYYQEMAIPSRECMSDTESGARRRLFANQRHNYRSATNRQGLASAQQQAQQLRQPLQIQQQIRPMSGGSFEWPQVGRLQPSQSSVTADDPTACTGVPPTLAEEPVDISGMLSTISVSSANNQASSLMIPSMHGSANNLNAKNYANAAQWSAPVSSAPSFPSSPHAVYAITHHPSINTAAPGLLQVNLQSQQQRSVALSVSNNSLKQQQPQQPLNQQQQMAQGGQTLPGFVGHSTPHNCLGRMEPDSLISVGAGSTDSGFDTHSQPHGSNSANGQVSGGAGVQGPVAVSMSTVSPNLGSGMAPSSFPAVDARSRETLATVQESQQQQQQQQQQPQQTNLDDSDLVSIDATANQQQYSIFSAVILKNPGLGFSIAGGRDSGRYLPFDDPTGVYVTKVQSDGPASSTLRIGDKLLAVDGRSFEAISHQDAVTVLRSCGPRVELRVARVKSSAMSPYHSETSVFRPSVTSPPITNNSVANYA